MKLMPPHKNIQVDYLSAADTRRQPKNDRLEEGWLHQLFLITHSLTTWPAWKLAVGLLALAALVGLAWLPLGQVAVTAAAIYLGFALTDWILLSWLPASHRSYGPIGPQLLVLTTPRLVVALLPGLVGGLFGGSNLFWLTLLALLQAIGTAIYLWATLYEPFALGLTHKTIRSPSLNGKTPPIRLLHLSDLHVERLTAREADLMQKIRQTKPDIIAITGDYLNLSYVDDPLARTEVRRMLAELQAPLGIYATLGSPPVDPRLSTPSLFDGLDNIRLLRDEAAIISLPGGATLSLLGLDCSHTPEIDGRVFQHLEQLTPADSTRVLLYHSPELMPLVKQYPVDLYLCGHTHGGQVRLPLYGAVLTSSVLGKQYEMGEYTEQNTTLYISRGIGLEGLSAPRMRLLCPPEIILFTLEGGGVSHLPSKPGDAGKFEQAQD